MLVLLLLGYARKIQRTSNVVFGKYGSSSSLQTRGFGDGISDCYINVTSKIDDPFLPNLTMDQSYGLSVSASGIEITAATAIGRSHTKGPSSRNVQHPYRYSSGEIQSQVLCTPSRAFLSL